MFIEMLDQPIMWHILQVVVEVAVEVDSLVAAEAGGGGGGCGGR